MRYKVYYVSRLNELSSEFLCIRIAKQFIKTVSQTITHCRLVLVLCAVRGDIDELNTDANCLECPPPPPHTIRRKRRFHWSTLFIKK